ncbi:uncharacterized protein STEHIDRAFT_47086 [Stereum hirsutum FP-91666 SS1]|uniref:uncharacterized protein n=1 Tax=Stereum hirsutum (strain FP-91666) TaxID=721885 RepID=UPI000440DA0B|nr:uncharacterized protein STEHIDRAFT_47086 [Stereum hirsutum FP-91666 SS1]EIM92200.1 hypothetical protein STEHIDRAFT_47086 [Stereum hirsutum FP-91666 SS1]
MAIAHPLAGPSVLRDIVNPQFHQNNFPEELFIKQELGIKLDKDEQICRLNLSQTGCPLGPSLCPLRHTNPSAQNFQPPKQLPTHPRDRERLATVCKHWLRGLCKKGDACEFLHEYNLRRMPECWWYAKYGYCSAGDECLYAHPKERKVECPDYKRGFCKLGPKCPRKHIRRVACQLYLTGFCPLGPDCPRGHPKPNIPPPKAYDPPEPPSHRDLGPPPPGYGRYADFDRTFLSGGGGGGGQGPGFNSGPRRNLDEVLCFKCGEKGHYANHCRNRNVPGNRGGVDRSGVKRFDTDED